jgi:hypothetical protein
MYTPLATKEHLFCFIALSRFVTNWMPAKYLSCSCVTSAPGRIVILFAVSHMSAESMLYMQQHNGSYIVRGRMIAGKNYAERFC